MKNNLYQEFIVSFKHSFRIKRNIVLAFLLFAGVAYTTGVYAQNMHVTIVSSNITAGQVLSEIENQTDYLFVYDVNEVNLDRKVYVRAENRPVSEVLDEIFEGTGITYAMEGKNIMLMKKPEKEKSVSRQQTSLKPLQGIVTDANGEPVIGANIKVEGTSIGTITDLDGRFTLDVPTNAVLQVSYIGYVSQNVKVGSKQDISIRLEEDAQALDEVVVIGYGSMKKSDLTGAVASANLKDFEKAPNSNILQSLQGTVPGLNIGQVTSAGGTPNIQIRGTNTLSGNKSVLIVLDGIIYTSSLSSINPNDIESIDVLKDASATAVYGAQAANGVLLITTKKGKQGRTKVEFSSAYTTSTPTKDLRPMNRQEFLDFTKEFWYDKAYTGPDYTTPNPEFNVADYLPSPAMLDSSQPDGISSYDYSWWDAGTRTGSMWENRLSLSGGNEAMSYLISFSNTDQKGYIVNDNFRRNSIRVNLDVRPFRWLKTGVQAFGSFVNQDGVSPDVKSLIQQSQMIEPYDEEGVLKPYPFNSVATNPFMTLEIDDKERHNYFFANVYAEIQLPVKGLTYRFNFGNNYRIDEHFQSNKYGASLEGEAYKHHTSYYDWTFDNIVNYNGEFGDHDISATFLYGASERKENYTGADAQQFSRLALGYNALELGTNQFVESNAWSEALLYQMFRLNYKFKDRYLLTATVRRDGFSGFAENNKTAIFPSVALGWTMSEEKWFKVSWIDQLKLRGGWGISGNQTSRYTSLPRMQNDPGYVFGDGGSTEMYQQVSSMGNNDLKWEKTAGFNLGLDFALFKSRLTGSLELYSTTTRDLLYSVTIPTITGFASVYSNIGKIRNKGIELTITSHNFATSDFEWNTTFNISANNNKILTLLGKDNDGDGLEDDLTSSNLFIGESTSAIYTYKIDGIWQLDDDIPTGYHPGNYRVVDIDNSGDITTDDRMIIGKGDPAYRFGILNTFRYKDFTFSFFINSVQGGKNGYMQRNSDTLNRGDENHRLYNRISEMGANYWSPNNPNAEYARSINAPSIGGTRYQQRNFVRLQDISLGYNFPKSWLNRLGIDNINLYISGKNLLTFTKWDGWDPESGSDYYGRPVLKSFTVGLNVSL